LQNFRRLPQTSTQLPKARLNVGHGPDGQGVRYYGGSICPN
jgi:hypothetical protein